MSSINLTPSEILTCIILYSSSAGALILMSILWHFKKIETWMFYYYVISVGMCGFGWEFWFAYGWAGGESIAERRSGEMNRVIPPWLNGILNSFGDAFAISLFGLILVILIQHRKTPKNAFKTWNYKSFLILFIWFVGENIAVELTIYQKQLKGGKLSWAPLSPFGNWWNPKLFINGNQLQL